MRLYCRTIVSLVVVMFMGAVIVFGQGGSTSVSGRVTDPGGLAVAGVKIEAANTDTNVVYPAATNDAGIYSLPSLPPGNYRITASKDGFENIVRPNVVLHVADNVSIDFSMQVGQLNQSVTVEGGAPEVNTTTSSLGGLVEAHEVANLPLNGRNYINLTLMQPGIATNPNMSTTAAFVGTWFASNGATIRSNNFMLDGAIMQDLTSGTTATLANRTLGLDGIQEYRVITNNFSAEYGLVMGSQTVMVSKTGTNQFHGSAFEFLRNSALDAANFFDKPTAANGFRRLPEFQRNNFGGSFGGPIQKDKTFFFATYEGLRENLGVTINTAVPAAACHGAAGTVVWNGAGAQPPAVSPAGHTSRAQPKRSYNRHDCTDRRTVPGALSESKRYRQHFLSGSVHSTGLRQLRAGSRRSCFFRQGFRVRTVHDYQRQSVSGTRVPAVLHQPALQSQPVRDVVGERYFFHSVAE